MPTCPARWLALIPAALLLACENPDAGPGGGADDDSAGDDDDATGDDDDGSAVPLDFDGDGRADLAVYHPGSGLWSIRNSSDGSEHTITWGSAATVPLPGDYDGDGLLDAAVQHQRGGSWDVRQSSDGVAMEGGTIAFGWMGAAPVPADYDGDGRVDLAVYHPEPSEWYVRRSSDGQMLEGGAIQLGQARSKPAPADYDGDGLADLATYEPSEANWTVRCSSTGEFLDGTELIQFGWSEAYPVPADYDGDGRADIAVHFAAGGDWYIRRSSDGTLEQGGAIPFGPVGGIPVPGDYDGDGRDDIAAYDLDSGQWHVRLSVDGSSMEGGAIPWGGDEAVPAGGVPRGIVWDAEIDLPDSPDVDGIDNHLDGNTAASFPVVLTYAEDWIIQADMAGLNGAANGRYLTYDKGSYVDVFPRPEGILALRVYNRKIWFRVDPVVGGGHALYPSYKNYDGTYDEEGNPNYTCDETLTHGDLCDSDHVGATLEDEYYSGDHSMRMEYLISRNRTGNPDDGVYRFYWDDRLVGDWNIWMQEQPPDFHTLWAGRMSGGVLRYHQGRFQTVIGE